MAYAPDAVLAKLSALNESHDSIATAAQWIMFHRRHADNTVQLWLQRLKDSPSPKRLNLIYLANEVTQQSKARHKDDFLVAFSPVIAEATAAAYKGAPTEVQAKLRRVIEVWRERSIFEQPIQAAIEARIEELDKARGVTRTGGFGGSIFGSSSSSVPPELKELVAPQQSVSKHLIPMKSAVGTANTEYDKLMDPASQPPAPPVFAARLNGLLKHLATAENAVAQSVKARKELLAALEKVVAANRAALETEEQQQNELSSRSSAIGDKKQEVETSIMRNLGNGEDAKSPDDQPPLSPGSEPDRPVVEALTPPSTHDDQDFSNVSSAPPNGQPQSPPPPYPHSPPTQHQSTFPSSAPGIEILSNLASHYQAVPVATSGPNKRRRLDSGEDFPDLGADDGIDPDVAEMLRKDSNAS